MPALKDGLITESSDGGIRINSKGLQTILDFFPMGIVLMNQKGTITHFNKRVPRLLGIPQSAIVGRMFNELLSVMRFPDGSTIPEDQRLFTKVRVTLQPVVGMHLTSTPQTGRKCHYLLNGAPLFNKTGEFGGIVATIDDITGSKQMDLTLDRASYTVAENEQFLSNIFASIQDGLSVVDEHLTVARVNPIMEKWYARNMPLVGKKCFEVYHNRSEPCEFCPTLQTRNSNKTTEKVVPKMERGGKTTGWVELYSFPMVNVDTGKIQGVIDYVRDITARKRAEDAIAESEDKYRTLFEANLAAVMVCSMDGKILDANPALYQFTGFSPEELPQFKTADLYVNPEDRKPIIEALQKFGQVQNVEVELKQKGGTGWGTLFAKIIEIKGEKRMMVISLDTTEKRRAENALKEIYEKTLQISEMKTNLITFAAHELKTPLTPIIGWIDVFRSALQKGLSLGEIANADVLESISNSANRLDRIINNFLDVERLERGRIELQRSEQSIAKLMDNAIKNALPLARKRNIEITNGIQDEVLKIDPVRIEEVFLNLLTNAIKYSPENTVVSISSAKTAKFCSIAIRDQGFGFSEEELHDAWHPLSKTYLRKQSLESVPGTGVGLYLAKALTEQHGGTIEIYSEGRDKGTTVTINLPFLGFM